MLTHLAADVCENFVPVLELHPEHSVRERFENGALYLDGTVFLGQVFTPSVVAGLVA